MQAVSFARGGTYGDTALVEVQFLAVPAYPTDSASGVACHEGVSRYILGYDGTRTDEAVRSEAMPANNGGIGSNGRASMEYRFAVFSLAAHRSTGVYHIGEDHTRSEEDIVLAADSGIDRHIVLYLAVAPQYYLRRDNDILPYIAVLTDDAVRHDVREMPYLGASTDGAIIVHIGRRMDIKLLFVPSQSGGSCIGDTGLIFAHFFFVHGGEI